LIYLDLLRFQDQLRFQVDQQQRFLLDPIRNKKLKITPEELVRQLLLIYLIQERHYNKNRIAVERGLQFHEMKGRWDILVYAPDLSPFMLIECKAPGIPLDQFVLDQAGRYNISLQVPYVLICNGEEALCYQIDFEQATSTPLPDLPEYPG